jgi:serine/threonine-protein kinase HipA
MNRCPITYDLIPDGALYSAKGLKLLNTRLRSLEPLGYTAEQQREEALQRAGKMSVQGLQLKLSAVLLVSEGKFDVVDRNGRFLLKPPSLDFPEMPENEDVTMRLAASIGIDVPMHGLLRARDDSLTYFIQRFDRSAKNRIPIEDFAQLSGHTRETKYDSSMEKVAAVVDRFCTFPAIERVELFRRTLFSFLVGNEDMHLKNFSLMRNAKKVVLAPGYDLVNSAIILKQSKDEMALPIAGKRSGLTARHLLDYFAIERLRINQRVIDEIISQFQGALHSWVERINTSFLSADMKKAYIVIIRQRVERLNWDVAVIKEQD